MSKSPFQSWLAVQERRRSHFIFLVEWVSIFAIAVLYWSFLFHYAPGSIPPVVAAVTVAALYATSLIYGRLLRATGCNKCASPLPFSRREVGRRRLPDGEDCMEVQYGSEEYGQEMIQVYCRVVRADMVTYRCRRCGQYWEERIERPGSGFQPVRRIRTRK